MWKRPSEKVYDAQKEYNEAYEEYLAEKTDTEEKLNQALAELKKAEREIKEQEEKLKDAEQRIADGEKEYRKSLLDYEEALRKIPGRRRR